MQVYCNMERQILVCGSRGFKLTEEHKTMLREKLKDNILIEGCCKNSPDEEAEKIARELSIRILHFPGHLGKYLSRNIDMIELADEVIAFWDGTSRGTDHVIRNSIARGKILNEIRW